MVIFLCIAHLALQGSVSVSIKYKSQQFQSIHKKKQSIHQFLAKNKIMSAGFRYHSRLLHLILLFLLFFFTTSSSSFIATTVHYHALQLLPGQGPLRATLSFLLPHRLPLRQSSISSRQGLK